jgi:hypothetical protein
MSAECEGNFLPILRISVNQFTHRIAGQIGVALLLQGLIISNVPLARSQPSPAGGDPATGVRPGSAILERYPDRLQAHIELRQRVASPHIFLSG